MTLGLSVRCDDLTDASDVGQDVDPAEFLLHLFEQADERGGVGEIADPVGRLRAVPLHLIDEGLKPLLTRAPCRSPPLQLRPGPARDDDQGLRKPRSRRRPSPGSPRPAAGSSVASPPPYRTSLTSDRPPATGVHGGPRGSLLTARNCRKTDCERSSGCPICLLWVTQYPDAEPPMPTHLVLHAEDDRLLLWRGDTELRVAHRPISYS